MSQPRRSPGCTDQDRATAPRRVPPGQIAAGLLLALVAGLAAGLHAGLEPGPAVGRAGAAPAPGPGPAIARTALEAPESMAGLQQAGLARPLAIPILNHGAWRSGRLDDVCRSWVSVQNLGEVPSQAILLVWPAPDDGRGCEGPLKAECTGLIRPGHSWDLLGAQIPTGSASAMLFSFNALRLSDLGVDLGFDDSVASYLCERIFYDVVGDCAAYQRFRAAYQSGGTFAGVPLAVAAGAPLAAQVLRHCPGTRTPGVEASSTYLAPLADAPRGDGQPYTYQLLPAGAGPGEHAAAYVQATGALTATVQVRFRGFGVCEGEGEDIACPGLVVTPGEIRMVDVAACAGEGASGRLLLESDQPLAAVLDLAGRDGLSSLAAAGALDLAAEPDAAGQIHYEGGLVYEAGGRWETTVYLSNPSGREAAVEGAFLDAGGQAIDRFEARLCPGGGLGFQHAIADHPPATRPVRVRITSAPAARGQAAVPVLAALRLEQFGSSGRETWVWSTALERLEPLPPAPGVPVSEDSMPLAGGIGALAVPLFQKDLDGTGTINELALANRQQAPGWTEVALLSYDANALVSVRCRRLPAGQMQVLDQATQHQPWTGFRGALIVSASWWSHVQADQAFPPLLGAGIVSRTGTRRGEDVPGDELALTGAIPLARAPESLHSALAGRCDPEPAVDPPEVLPPAGERPNAAALDALAFLPTISNLGQNEECQARLTIRNAGDEPLRALLVLYGEPGFALPQSAGPLYSLCTEPIPPGETGTLEPEDLPPGSFSAVAYGLGPATLGEAGVEPGSEASLAEAICEQAEIELPGDERKARRLHLAWLTGGQFVGRVGALPLAPAAGPPLALEVERSCPADITLGRTVTARYAAPSGQAFDLRDPLAVQGDYRYSVTPVHADYDDYHSIVYLQNAGLEAADIRLRFAYLGDCLFGRVCRVFALAPGESFQWDASDCVGPSWLGSVVVQSSQPLAVVGERIGQDTLTTLHTRPGGLPFDLNGDGRVDPLDLAAVEAALGSAPGDPAWDPGLDLDASGAIDESDLDLARLGQCQWPVPAGASEPPDLPSPRRQAHLPALAHDGPGAEDCRERIAIQNLGAVPSKAILVLFSAPVEDPRDPGACAGPAKVECSGLIAPGGSWSWEGGLLGSFASGTVYSVNGVVTTDDLDLNIDAPDTVANILCETLFFGVVGDCDDYRRFKRAWDEGADFASLPLGDERVTGAPLAIRVERDCASLGRGLPAGSRELAAYAAIADTQLGSWDEPSGGFGYFAPILLGDKAGLDARLWLQNAGSVPAEVEVHVARQNDCNRRLTCDARTIQAGESTMVDSTCFSPDFQGTAWIRSTQPLAALAEMRGRGVRLAYAARPAAAITQDLSGEPLPEAAGTRLFAPLAPSPHSGWDLGLNVQNTSLDRDAWVEVEYLDAQGLTLEAFDARICPGNTETFFVPVSGAMQPSRGGPIGSIRVTSRPPELAAWEPPAPISAVAWHLRSSDVFRTESFEAVALELLPERQVGAWPLGRDPGGPATGSAILALPGLAYDPPPDDPGSWPDGTASQLVIGNLLGLPGRTDAELRVLDGKGQTLATRPLSLAAGQTERIDLASLALPAGFRGSALVSATFWDHGLPGPVGGGRARVGLGAVVLGQAGPDAPAAGQPGPRMSATLAEPLRQLPALPEREDVTIHLPFASRGF